MMVTKREIKMMFGKGGFQVAAALLVGSGTGCDARINGEPKNEQFYRDLRAWDRRNAAAVREARKAWGV